MAALPSDLIGDPNHVETGTARHRVGSMSVDPMALPFVKSLQWRLAAFEDHCQRQNVTISMLCGQVVWLQSAAVSTDRRLDCAWAHQSRCNTPCVFFRSWQSFTAGMRCVSWFSLSDAAKVTSRSTTTVAATTHTASTIATTAAATAMAMPATVSEAAAAAGGGDVCVCVWQLRLCLCLRLRLLPRPLPCRRPLWRRRPPPHHGCRYYSGGGH